MVNEEGGFRQLADSPCIYVNKIMHEVDEITNIVTDVVGDPTLPRLVPSGQICGKYHIGSGFKFVNECSFFLLRMRFTAVPNNYLNCYLPSCSISDLPARRYDTSIVADPDPFFTDPDPGFFPIRIQAKKTFFKSINKIFGEHFLFSTKN